MQLEKENKTTLTNPELPTQTQPSNHSHKKLLIMLIILVLIVLASSVGAYLLFKPMPMPHAVTKVSPKPPAKPSVQYDTIKLVKATYTSTNKPGYQNSQDGPALEDNGSYLELNGNGELNFNGQVVASDKRIKDPVLSNNGKHYAYRLELSSTDFGQVPTKSELYIDNNKVADLEQTSLLAVGDDGASYITKDYSNTKTPTVYNTGIRSETVMLNSRVPIVSSPYGFLGVEASADLKNTIATSRNYNQGITTYYNGQELKSCSTTTNAAYASAALVDGGADNICIVYYLDNAPAGSGLNYNINKLQVFIDDTPIINNSTVINADGPSLFGFASKADWVMGYGTNIVNPDGSIESFADYFPAAASALNEPSCNGYTNLFGARLIYVSKSKLALLIPCTKEKLFTIGFNFASQVDLSQYNAEGVQYSPSDHILYLYGR